MKVKPILLRQLNIDPERHRVISIVGAGGKSSMMDRLRKELVTEGLRVIVTTSTHIAYDESEPFAADGDIDKLKGLIDRHGYAVTGSLGLSKDGKRYKLSSVGEEKLQNLREICDVMLIEADGARGNYIKVPADWEPVIYPWTDLVIGLASAIAVNKSIEEIAYRPEDLAEFLDKNPKDAIELHDIMQIATSASGLRKHVGDRDYRFYLNATDAGSVEQSEIEAALKQLKADQDIMAHCGALQHLDEVGAVILAAGLGTRFGGSKLEAKIADKPMYRHVLDEMAEVFGYDSITFVTNRGDVVDDHSNIAEDIVSTGADVVINEHPEDGISSSMRLGLMANIHKGSCLFAVADQPMIKSTSIRGLVSGYMGSDKLMASMTDGLGEYANPCIFSAAYYDSLLQIRGDRGGKSVIVDNPEDVFTYTPADIKELEDIDTTDDYERLEVTNV